jgi:hypothetical protein
MILILGTAVLSIGLVMMMMAVSFPRFRRMSGIIPMGICCALLLLSLGGCANGEPLSVPHGKWEPINYPTVQAASTAR